MFRTVALVAVTTSLCALFLGCVVEPNRPHPGPYGGAPPAAQGNVEEIPIPAQPPVDTAKGAVEGRPAQLRDGAPEAFWIWHDASGWKVRTTTAHASHRFQGRVWVVKGEVANVHPVRLEHNDRLRQHGNNMAFDFTTDGHEDGFDFQIAEGECAHFNLEIDGKGRPDRIFIGAQELHPSHHVFRLCR